ncbi:hypothetical protein AA0472_0816 [Acetobacter estunensis NRIC 0472]|nr:hypothetical protein AA0472_0816 [Acetobacter estunensis NRIC 0472]
MAGCSFRGMARRINRINDSRSSCDIASRDSLRSFNARVGWGRGIWIADVVWDAERVTYYVT